ncbi:SMI1/KNR4 family protein [Streptomyces sp. NPDC101733]|uniref:SMI1/KNR4 family protein n=1 Tax=unclassified Streptomyces TaxID=2593676 RepID=UPI0038025A11
MSSHPDLHDLARVLKPCRGSGEGAPGDLAGIAEAERRLGIRLPSDYIAFIETYGAGEVGEDSMGIPQPYNESEGSDLVSMAELFWEQAPAAFTRYLPAGMDPRKLIRWGFTSDCLHLFWVITSDDSNEWPVADLQEDGGPFTVHNSGFAAFLKHHRTKASDEAGEPVQFIHWREYDRLMERGINPAAGLYWNH